MSDKNENKEEESKEEATTSSSTSKRSRKDLKKTPHGMILLIIRAAFSLAKQNGFAGTLQEDSEYQSQVVYTKGKPGGAFEGLEVGGDEFNKVLDAAKAAQSDIDKLNYSDEVKALIDAWVNIPKKSRVGGGLKEGSVSDLDLSKL